MSRRGNWDFCWLCVIFLRTPKMLVTMVYIDYTLFISCIKFNWYTDVCVFKSTIYFVYFYQVYLKKLVKYMYFTEKEISFGISKCK